mmetsp:Transcript_28320/g.58001  ORF Transcript_28320/g.58001 Transcript_28320/m.58001 type:complete len:254 (-) Transcript_28320:226-987(-)
MYVFFSPRNLLAIVGKERACFAFIKTVDYVQHGRHAELWSEEFLRLHVLLKRLGKICVSCPRVQSDDPHPTTLQLQGKIHGRHVQGGLTEPVRVPPAQPVVGNAAHPRGDGRDHGWRPPFGVRLFPLFHLLARLLEERLQRFCQHEWRHCVHFQRFHQPLPFDVFHGPLRCFRKVRRVKYPSNVQQHVNSVGVNRRCQNSRKVVDGGLRSKVKGEDRETGSVGLLSKELVESMRGSFSRRRPAASDNTSFRAS